MPRIAISYRREDSGVITGRIFDRLIAHYGRESVFRDIDNIPFGVDFRDHVNRTLDASDIVLAIVGPRWVGPRANQSRLANEADPVRVEIEAVLRKGTPLIPVLVLRASMPRADQLPEPLKPLAYRNAVSVDAGQDFDVHMNRLIRGLDELIASGQATPPHEPDIVAVPPPAPEPTPAEPTSPSPAKDPATPVVLAPRTIAPATDAPATDATATDATATDATATDATATDSTKPQAWWLRPALIAGVALVIAVIGYAVVSAWQRPTTSVPPVTTTQPSEPADQTEAERRRKDAEQRQRSAAAEREQRAYEAAKGNPAALHAYINMCVTCADAAAARSEISKLEDAGREQQAYNAARGNAVALRAYLSACKTCDDANDARAEIARLETAAQEQKVYVTAKGNLYGLRSYLNTCVICADQVAARDEIAQIEAAQTRSRAASATLCGRSVDYVIDPAGVSEAARSFLGVWTGAAWNSRICGSLVIEAVASNGTARLKYVYGPLPGSQFPWKLQQPTGTIRNGQLNFNDDDGGAFTFRLNGQNALHGQFVSSGGGHLDADLTRDPASAP